MQTFLPYSDFYKSAWCLDRQRLGKQRVETLQILKTLAGMTNGWQNHPAVKMWRGYEGALTEYGTTVCDVWIERGYKDTCRDKIFQLYKDFFHDVSQVYRPWWLDGKIHKTHQSKLIQKFPEHYRPIFGNVPDNLDYYWPVTK